MHLKKIRRTSKQYRLIYDPNLKHDFMLDIADNLNTYIAQKEETERRKGLHSKSESSPVNPNLEMIQTLRKNFMRQYEDHVNSGGKVDQDSDEYKTYRILKWQEIAKNQKQQGTSLIIRL